MSVPKPSQVAVLSSGYRRAIAALFRARHRSEGSVLDHRAACRPEGSGRWSGQMFPEPNQTVEATETRTLALSMETVGCLGVSGLRASLHR
jgi:hypothetical protein